MAAVVVTEQLDWRLHGFDLLSEHGGGGFDWPLTAASWMV
jgi:SCY1-like protein 1